MNSAIVLGTNVNGLGVIRSLGRMGVKCGAIFAPESGDHAPKSRYLSASVPVDQAAGHNQLVNALDHVSSKLQEAPPVLIPTTDKFSQFLCEHQEYLSKRYLLRCASKEIYDAFLDKWKTDRICRENNIRVPATRCPQTLRELTAESDKIRFPVIVKPRYTFETGFPGKNAVFENADELRDFFACHDVVGGAIIQELIPSGDGDILVVACYSGHDGLVKAMYSGRKIRQFLPDYGATCYGISERNIELEIAASDFLNNIGYKGFAALEYARSREDGKSYFLELNTRTYYHNQLFSDAGVDLTKIAYQEITGIDKSSTAIPIEQRDGLIWIDFRRDYYSMRIKRKQGIISIPKWAASLLKPRSFAYWSISDPAPFIAACSWRTKQLLSKLFQITIASIVGTYKSDSSRK